METSHYNCPECRLQIAPFFKPTVINPKTNITNEKEKREIITLKL